MDGTQTKVAAKGVELLKRQANGTWKVIIDHAFGAETNLTAQ
jgi:ketosteroid isomerase-like protein